MTLTPRPCGQPRLCTFDSAPSNGVSRLGDVNPEFSRDVLRKMFRVGRGDNDTGPVEGHRLGGQDHVAVECGVWCSWPSFLTCLSPERGGLTHCRSYYGEESDLRDERIEPCNSGGTARPDEFTSQLVIGDFRDQDRDTAVNRIHDPTSTGCRHRRRPGIRDQA